MMACYRRWLEVVWVFTNFIPGIQGSVALISYRVRVSLILFLQC